MNEIITTDYTALDVIGAIRLAMEGSGNDDTTIALIQALLRDAPESRPEATAPVRLFVETIQALGASVTISPS